MARDNSANSGKEARPNQSVDFYGLTVSLKDMSEALKRVHEGWIALRKSAVTFDGEVASTEHPDAVVARANAFLHRLADTERRIIAFRAHIQEAQREAFHSAEEAQQLADALEDRVWLTPLEEEFAAVFGRQTLPRIQHYNGVVSDCLKALEKLTEQLRVSAGQLSIRNVRVTSDPPR